MKRRIIALLALLALLLTACGSRENQQTDTDQAQTDVQTENQEESSGDDVTNPGETSSLEEEESLPTVCVRMEPNQSEIADEDGTVLCYARLTIPTVSIEDNEGAAGAINDRLAAQADQRSAEAQTLAEQARESRAVLEESGGFYGFSTGDTVSVGRADSRVISLLWKASYYSGGAHDSTIATGWVFDAETGERLSLADVTGDYDALSQLLTDRVTAQIEADSDRYFPQAAEQIPQLLEDGGWYFSDEGLVLVAAPELLAPYAAGTLEFTVPYEDLQDLLDESRMPEKAAVGDGTPQIALTLDDGAPAADHTVYADASGTEMVLWADGDLADFRIWRVSSSDGVTWYRGDCCYAVNRLEAGEMVELTAMLPDVMTNTMISYTAADGSTVYRGIGESGKDGSVFYLDLDTVMD